MTAGEACELAGAYIIEVCELRAECEALGTAHETMSVALAQVTAERESYRLVAKQAIHYAAEVTRENAKLRQRNAQLLEDWRAARGFSTGSAFLDRQAIDVDQAVAA